jgi:hypothetical protein
MTQSNASQNTGGVDTRSREADGRLPGQESSRAYTDPSYSGAGQYSGAASRSAAMASGLNIIAGLWLIISPWVLNYSQQNNAVWDAVVIGSAIAILALARTAAPRQFEQLSWVNVLLGAWMVIAPFVLVYNAVGSTTGIYWNDIVTGLIVIGLAVWSWGSTVESRSN